MKASFKVISVTFLFPCLASGSEYHVTSATKVGRIMTLIVPEVKNSSNPNSKGMWPQALSPDTLFPRKSYRIYRK